MSGVSKKTIARIEGGKSSANTVIVKRLAEALDVRPKDLSGQSGLSEEDETKEKMRRTGFRALKTPIRENTDLAFQMVEKRYGISQRGQVSLAPLLAEGSLDWRRQKHDEAGKAIDTLLVVSSIQRIPLFRHA